MTNIPPSSASFLVTEDCNLACKYCFEKHNKNTMSEDVVVAALEFLSDNAIKNHERNFHAMIFGGEPLLNIDLVEKIFVYGERLARRKGLRFTSSIVTNATIMNDRIYGVLSKHKDSSNLTIQLSIDGDKESQDMYRVTKTGKGSFALVEKNIARFRELFSGESYRLCVHSCINKNTVSRMFENFRFFYEDWKFENIWFLPVMEENWDADDIKIYDRQEAGIYDYIRRLIENTGDINYMNAYSPLDRCLNEGRADKPCGAGSSFVSITASGDIFPCHQIYFNNPDRSELLGNVLDGNLDEDVREKYLSYTSACIDCPSNCEVNNCYRCIAVNRQVNGDILKQVHGYYCDLMKIDKKYQDELKVFLRDGGYLGPQPVQEECGECLCNAREGSSAGGCDIVNRQSVCESGNNPDNPNCLCDINDIAAPIVGAKDVHESDFEEVSTLALQLILQEIKELKQKVAEMDERLRSKD